MKRLSRFVALLLLMALIVSAIPAVVSAEDSAPVDGSNEELDVPTVIPDSEDTENKTRVQIYNEQGFNFPEEGDLTVPKFKLVTRMALRRSSMTPL